MIFCCINKFTKMSQSSDKENENQEVLLTFNTGRKWNLTQQGKENITIRFCDLNFPILIVTMI